MSKVYIVQQQLMRSPDGKLVDKFRGVEKAEKFGELVYVLDPQAFPTKGMQFHVAKMQLAMKDFTEKDYILPIGNPIFIGMAFGIACAKTNGKVRALSWSRQHQEYVQTNVEI